MQDTLPKFTQEAADIMNRPISIKLIQSLITSQDGKHVGPGRFTGKFCQTSKEEILSNLYILFQKTEVGILSDSFYEASVTAISKPGKDIEGKKPLQINIFHEHIHRSKNSQQHISKSNPKNVLKNVLKNVYIMIQVGFTPGVQG